MIYEELEQRSKEWFELRKGMVTASRFGDILTSTGKKSSKQDGYIDDLVADHLSLEPLEGFTNDAMQRGIDLEPEARRAYSERAGWDVKEVAFITHESLPIGCSPDGVVTKTDIGFRPLELSDLLTGVEIKCPGERNHANWMRKGKCPAVYEPQIQGTMLICGVPFWDFFTYHPQMSRQWMFRVEYDEQWGKDFAEEVQSFHSKVQKAIKEAEHNGI